MRLLLVSDTHGRLGIINDLVRQAQAEAVIHAGDFGFHDDESYARLSDRELRLLVVHSDLPKDEKERLLGLPRESRIEAAREHRLVGEFQSYIEGSQSFQVPVYAVWGKSFHVTTNAILLDDERIRFLDEHGFSMIVSMDGPEDIHNRLRPAKDPKVNSHAATLANLRKLKATRNLKNRTTLRSTYTGLGSDLVRRLEFLNGLVWDGCASHASVEPCSLNETACLKLPDGHPLAITSEHFDGLRKEYHDAAEWFVAQVRAGRNPRFHHFMKPLERLLYTIHSPTECGAACGYLGVDPSGTIYGCHRESKSVLGHLDTGIDEEARAKWKDNRFYTRPACVACDIKHACGGGCRLDSLERHGDIHRPDEVGCFFKRRMFEEALWILCELGPDKVSTLIPNPRDRRAARPQPRKQRKPDCDACGDACKEKEAALA